MPERHVISLEQLDVPAPCHEPWRRMSGDDRTRFCERCQHPVHNLSKMTRQEAEKILSDSSDGVCVQFTRARDGNVRTLDYQPRAATRPRGKMEWFSIASLSVLIGAVLGGLIVNVRATQGMARTRLRPPAKPATQAAIRVRSG